MCTGIAPPGPHGGARRPADRAQPGGSITVIEGDHGSACFHPDHAGARRAVAGLYRAAEDDGTFCHTFFKAEARRGILTS